MNRHHTDLIDKFLHDDLTKEEVKALKKWIKHPKNKAFLKKEIQLYHLINAHYQIFDAEKAYRKNLNKLSKNNLPLQMIFKYAALFLVLFGLGYVLYEYVSDTPSQGIEQLIIPEKEITLQVGEGTLKTITSGEEVTIDDDNGNLLGIQKGDTLRYHKQENKKELVFNTLHVPYGKTFNLVLSDGTRVHLNSGTRLRYPERFGKKNRNVFLEGEAYFDVAENPQVPFMVHTKEMAVRVSGTKFNVSAYTDDTEVFTVLVEGAVRLYGGEKGVSDSRQGTRLVPDQMGTWNRSSGEMQVRKVDVRDYISWMDGQVVFHKKRFKDILKVLERKYNVRIENHYPELDNQHYRVNFDNETIEQVMRTFTESRLFTYSIRDNVIVIKKPER